MIRGIFRVKPIEYWAIEDESVNAAVVVAKNPSEARKLVADLSISQSYIWENENAVSVERVGETSAEYSYVVLYSTKPV